MHISYVRQCPLNFPLRDACVQIRFSLPVRLHEDSSFLGYQLSKQHLTIMWRTLSYWYFTGRLANEPDTHGVFSKWLIIIFTVLLAFLIFLSVMRVIINRYLRDSKRRSVFYSNILVLVYNFISFHLNETNISMKSLVSTC